MRFILLFICIQFIACTSINQKSQDQYQTKSKVRHGIYPLNTYMDPSLPVLDIGAAQRGQKVYEVNCLSCHGRKGYGDGPESRKLKMKVKDISKLAKKVPRFKFFMMASRWQGTMPGWQNTLSKQELADLESYLVLMAQDSP